MTTSPADGATNVAPNATITATFSEAMDAATITAAGTFTVRTTVGAVVVPGTVTYNAGTNTATFTPTSPLSNSIAYYAQTAYRLPWLERLWKPYYRFEYIHIPRSDTLFRLVPGERASVVGFRYDVASFAAVKLEYRNVARPGLPRVNGAFAQTSFVF